MLEEVGAEIVALEPDATRANMYRVTVVLRRSAGIPDGGRSDGGGESPGDGEAGKERTGEAGKEVAGETGKEGAGSGSGARGSDGQGPHGDDGAQVAGDESGAPGAEEDRIVMNVHEDTVVAWRLMAGRRLTPAEWRQLSEQEAAEDAYRAALLLLEARPRTRKETEAALRRKGFAPQAIAACLERLVRHGLIDDATFAARFASHRVTGQRKGRRLIRQELLQRGIGREDAERAISAISEEEEREAALELARKRLRQVKAKTALERRHKLLALLIRRGFPQAVAREAVRTAMEEAGRTPEGDPGRAE